MERAGGSVKAGARTTAAPASPAPAPAASRRSTNTPREYRRIRRNCLAAPSGPVLRCGGPRCRDARGRPRGDPRGRPGGLLGGSRQPCPPCSLPIASTYAARTHRPIHRPLRRRADRVLMDAKHIWRAALGELQVALSPANFETWLRHTSLVEVDDTRFRIAVPNGFAKDWLESRYRPLISQTLARIVGYSVQVEFLVRADAGEVAVPAEATTQRVRVEPTRVGVEGAPRASTPAMPSPTSSSARPTGWPTRRPSPWRSGRAMPTTRSSSTAGSASARPTSCTRSATPSSPGSRASRSST